MTTTDTELDSLVQAFGLWNDVLAETADANAMAAAVDTLSSHVARDALMLHISPRLAAHFAGLTDERMRPFEAVLEPLDYSDPAARAVFLESVAVSQLAQNADMCCVVAAAHCEDEATGDPGPWLEAALNIDPTHLGAQYLTRLMVTPVTSSDEDGE